MNPEDSEPTEEEIAAMRQQDAEDEYWRMAQQEEEDRVNDLILDAGLDYGDLSSAAYALTWGLR